MQKAKKIKMAIDPQRVAEVEAALINQGRSMLSRKSGRKVNILSGLKGGEEISSCFACCTAPACCPIMAMCPCCADAAYIAIKRESSKYIYIRENSLEWNTPKVVLKQGVCFGVDPCVYDIQDNVQVLYFDDPIFDRITDQTRCCNECRTCFCGGSGERIQIDSPCCCNLCQRSACPCPCVPICCPTYVAPCALKYEIYVEDAQKGKYDINKALKTARNSSLYGHKPGHGGGGGGHAVNRNHVPGSAMNIA